MAKPKVKLDKLRQEIDDIDDALQDLIVRRTDVVGRIAEKKGRQMHSGMRPAREAEILRGLAARTPARSRLAPWSASGAR